MLRFRTFLLTKFIYQLAQHTSELLGNECDYCFSSPWLGQQIVSPLSVVLVFSSIGVMCNSVGENQ